VSVNGTLDEANLCEFTFESTHFIFHKCPIYTHDGASAKFSTKSQETDYSEGSEVEKVLLGKFELGSASWKNLSKKWQQLVNSRD
jgi:hypothetical protein